MWSQINQGWRKLLKHIKFKLVLGFAALLAVGGVVLKEAPTWFESQQEVPHVYRSTEDYLQRFDPDKYMRAGTDFFNPRYSLSRLGKPLHQINIALNYPLQYLEQTENKLKKVDRRAALNGIFKKVTLGASSDHERHLAVLNFLYKVSHHNTYAQPMYADKQAVFDPLLLIELGEMRCGGVARIGADLFESAGYQTRLVQAAAHTSAEIFYDGDWHLFEADLAGGAPITINGHIPSVEQLSSTPFLIDKIPTHFELLVAPLNPHIPHDKSLIYPSFFFFSNKVVQQINEAYYYKTATQKRPLIPNGMVGTTTKQQQTVGSSPISSRSMNRIRQNLLM